MKLPNHLTKLSSKEARADRIRHVRMHILEMTRPELCKDSEILETTLKGWEISLSGGLTESGAKKLIKRFSALGLHCSINWLLHGIGLAPSLSASARRFEITPEEESKITQELLLFRENNHNNTLDTIIEDDAMLPFLMPGMYVAGVLVNDFTNAIGKENIIITASNTLYVRVLVASKTTGKFDLVASNKNCLMSPPVITNIEVKMVAPIIWVRRKS